MRAEKRRGGWGAGSVSGVAAWALALAVATGLAGCDFIKDHKKLNPMSPKAVAFNGVDITGAAYAQTLRLPDTSGRLRSLDEFKGRVVFVFFGFTQCPDVCPTTLADLAEVRRQLGPDGARVQGVFVTLDPERDTPEVLTEYTRALDPTLVALRGSPEQVAKAAAEFKVYFQKVAAKDGKAGYSIDHTAGGFVFDPQGRVRLFTRYGQGPAALLSDVRTLLAESR